MSAEIERVLLELDASADTAAAIATATRLAARLKVRLDAVFVEDQDVLSLTALPVARQVVAGGIAAPLLPQEVELHLRAAAARLREEVMTAARGQAIDCSFAIMRGAVETALATASEHDLVVAGALARPVAGHFRIRSRWLMAADRAPGPFLLARQGAAARGAGIAALLRRRNAAAGRLVRAAARLAALADAPLTVISPPDLAASDAFGRWLEEETAAPRPRVEAAPEEPADLPRRLAELGCGMVAIGADAAAGGLENLREMTERLGCDLLVVP